MVSATKKDMVFMGEYVFFKKQKTFSFIFSFSTSPSPKRVSPACDGASPLERPDPRSASPHSLAARVGVSVLIVFRNYELKLFCVPLQITVSVSVHTSASIVVIVVAVDNDDDNSLIACLCGHLLSFGGKKVGMNMCCLKL